MKKQQPKNNYKHSGHERTHMILYTHLHEHTYPHLSHRHCSRALSLLSNNYYCILHCFQLITNLKQQPINNPVFT